MSRIAIDMDEVMADTFSKQLAWLETHRNIQLTPDCYHGKHIKTALLIEDYDALYQAMQKPDFFADLPVMPGAQSVIEKLSQHHELFIVTAAMEFPNSFNAKFNWLAEHFPHIRPEQIVFCGDKSMINTHFMIDDSPFHLSRFTGEALLFSAAHNRLEQRFKRMLNWEEVSTLFFDKNTPLV